MPDYNPAVASGIQAPQDTIPQTLNTINNLQMGQAHVGLYQLQALQQQREYNALQAAAQAPPGQRAMAYIGNSGSNPGYINALQEYDSNQGFAAAHGGYLPQAAEASSVIGRNAAETRNLNLEAPGLGAKSDTDIRAGASQLATQYSVDPTPENWQAMRDYTAKYQGPLAAAALDKITDPKARMARATGHIGGGLTAPEASTPTETQNAQGAPVYQTRAQFLASQNNPQGPAVGPTPQAVETQKQTAAKTIDYLQDAGYKQYASAQSGMQTMKVVDNDIDRLGPAWMGPGSSAKAESFKVLNAGLAQLSVDPINAEAVGSSEELGKESIRAGFQLGSSQFGGSREASQTIQTSIKAVVSQGNSYIGAKMVSSTIQAAFQRQIDLYKFQQAHPDQLPSKSAIQFDEQNPPEKYATMGIVNGIPQKDKDYLLANPHFAPRFDKAFGPGIAQAVLGQAQQ